MIENRGFEFGTVQLCLVQHRPREIGIAEIGASQIGLRQVRIFKVRTMQIGRFQIELPTQRRGPDRAAVDDPLVSGMCDRYSGTREQYQSRCSCMKVRHVAFLSMPRIIPSR